MSLFDARTNKISRPVAFEKQNLSYYTLKICQKLPDRKYKMTYLVKDLTDISLGFSKPHGEQFWALDWDEIGLALIGNGLGQQGFTTTWWSIEQHTLGWGHAKLKEFVWMFHWVLKQRTETIGKDASKSFKM